MTDIVKQVLGELTVILSVEELAQVALQLSNEACGLDELDELTLLGRETATFLAVDGPVEARVSGRASHSTVFHYCRSQGAVVRPGIHFLGSGSGTATNTFTLTPNALFLVPMPVARGGPFSTVRTKANLPVAGSSLVTALYRQEDFTDGTLVLDRELGSIDTSTSGVRNLLVNGTLEDTTLYWIAMGTTATGLGVAARQGRGHDLLPQDGAFSGVVESLYWLNAFTGPGTLPATLDITTSLCKNIAPGCVII